MPAEHGNYNNILVTPAPELLPYQRKIKSDTAPNEGTFLAIFKLFYAPGVSSRNPTKQAQVQH